MLHSLIKRSNLSNETIPNECKKMQINGISPLASVCTMVPHTLELLLKIYYLKNQWITFSLSDDWESV